MKTSKKVLIIDDELDLGLLLKGYFLRKDYEVFLSHTLDEGIGMVKTLNPDIIFLDNNLPDTVGWNSAPKIAQENPNTTIVLISAFHPVVPEMPADTHYMVIEKPIRLTDLDKHFASMV